MYKHLYLTPIATIMLVAFLSCKPDPDAAYRNFSFSSADSTFCLPHLFRTMRTECFDAEVLVCPDSTRFDYPSCFPRPSAHIDIDDTGQILINGHPDSSIVSFTCAHYGINTLFNERLGDTPLYKTINLEHINYKIEMAHEELYLIKNTPDANPEILAIKEKELREWEHYQKAAMLSVHQKISVSEETMYDYVLIRYAKDAPVNPAILDSVLYGIYLVREVLCQAHFKESYARLFYRYAAFRKTKDGQKVAALSTMLPLRVIDFSAFTDYRLKMMNDTYCFGTPHPMYRYERDFSITLPIRDDL